VAQHGGSANNTTVGLPGYLKLHRLIKRIAAGESSYAIPSIPELHSAASSTNNVTTKENISTNILLMNLMKRICSATEPSLL